MRDLHSHIELSFSIIWPEEDQPIKYTWLGGDSFLQYTVTNGQIRSYVRVTSRLIIHKLKQILSQGLLHVNLEE